MLLFGLNIDKQRTLSKEELLYIKGYIDAKIDADYQMNEEEKRFRQDLMTRFAHVFRPNIDDAYAEMFS